MRFRESNYLAPLAKRLIPKWARDFEHPEQISEFRQTLTKLTGKRREEIAYVLKMMGWRLNSAFKSADESERDWLIYDARRIYTAYLSFLGPEMASRPDVVTAPAGDMLDNLLLLVQERLIKRMRVCPRSDCKKKYFFKDPGRKQNRREYCGQFCAENAARESKLRCYHTSPNSRKNRPKSVTKIIATD